MALVPAMFNGRRIWVNVDIVDVETIARRLGKHRVTVWRKFLIDPTFPEPRLRLGKSNGYDWKEVQEWLTQKGYKP